MKLRPYQNEALQSIKEAYDARRFRLLVSHATGLGKTCLFSQVPQIIDPTKKYLVLVHRDELAKQAADKFRKWNPTYKVGIEMGNQVADLDCNIIIGSVQTLGRLNSSRLAELKPDDFAGVIVDECQHSIAPSYQTIFNHFGLLKPDNKKLLLGVTATPYRGNGQDLSSVFNEIIHEFNLFDAIQQGWLSDLKGLKLETTINLDKIKIVAGDFDQKELEATVNTAERNHAIAQTWVKYALLKQTLAFCVDIQHAKDLAAEFKKRGILAEAIWGVDPERHNKLVAYRAGKIQLLTNASLLNEGFDCANISCIISARPTKSQLLFVQQIGRGTRLQEGIDNILEARKAGTMMLTKEDCLVIDCVDNSSKHSLITLPTVVGLNKNLDLRGKSLVQSKIAIESAQVANPNIDLTKLVDIDRLKTVVEEIDLFKVRFPEEIKQESSLQWHRTSDGAYVLYVSKNEGVRVHEDLLGKWNYTLKIGANDQHESGFATRREALKWAEKMVSLTTTGSQAYYLRRSTVMDEQAATRPQLNFLNSLRIKYPPTISKGDASKLITQYQTRKFGVKA